MPFVAHIFQHFLAAFAIRVGMVLPAVAVGATIGPSVIIESFTAGGHEQILRLEAAEGSRGSKGGERFDQCYEPVRLPVTAQALDFRIAPNLASANKPPRFHLARSGGGNDRARARSDRQ